VHGLGLDIVGLLKNSVCLLKSLYCQARHMERLAFTIQEMQSSFHESSDGSGPIDEILGSPSLSLTSTNSNDSSDSPWISPRIGDNYQVNVSPFKLKISCDQVGMNKSKDYRDGKVEDFELLFVEGLSVPIMQICCFSPFGIGTSSDNEFHSKESFPVEAIEKDCGLYQLDLSELANDQCTHEISNSGQLREDNANCSITILKTKFLRPKDSTTESIVATENVLDSSSYCNERRRKRGKVGWKMVKKMKAGCLDLNKNYTDSNCQVQQ